MSATLLHSNTTDVASTAHLVAVLKTFHSFSEEAEQYLNRHTFPCHFAKNKLLLKAGQVCEHVYFIKKGVVRGFIREGQKEITSWITAENEMVTSISGLDNVSPAVENIQAIEACDLLALTFADLDNLYHQFPEFNIVIRKLLQKYYADAEARAFIARLTNAETKYRRFLAQYSHLINRIPLKYVASFLGITLETLSRIRKRISTSRP